ncbi:unnamed protein product [Allacma fusca]|uniref:Uncharacterized protein n=1 Tax=Allacma fusca TaxID=39272 RepID=A0A8J2PKD2_9HEXA|nr:unnamed protein product [Allacma fusca]
MSCVKGFPRLPVRQAMYVRPCAPIVNIPPTPPQDAAAAAGGNSPPPPPTPPLEGNTQPENIDHFRQVLSQMKLWPARHHGTRVGATTTFDAFLELFGVLADAWKGHMDMQIVVDSSRLIDYVGETPNHVASKKLLAVAKAQVPTFPPEVLGSPVLDDMSGTETMRCSVPGVLDLPQSDRMLKPCKAKMVLSESFQRGSDSFIRRQALLYMPWRFEEAQVEVEVERDALAFYEAQRQVISRHKALYRANINMPH